MADFYEDDLPVTIGRGKLLIRKEADVVWYDFAHVTEFKINLETEEKEHQNFRKALKVTDKTAVLGAKAKFSFNIDVPMVDNIKRFLLADDVDATDVVQTQGQWTAAEMNVEERNTWQVIQAGDAALTGRVNWCAVTAVTTGAGPTTLVENTDYLLDRNRGLIMILAAATLTDEKVKVTGSYGTITSTHGIKQVKAGSSANMKRHIWLQGDPAEGIVQDVIGYVLLKPTGELPFIGDEWQGFGFEGSFMANADYGDLGLIYEQRGEYGISWPVYA